MWLKNSLCSGKTCHIIIIGGVLCLLLWVVDSALDATVFREHNVVRQLFSLNPHKLLNFGQSAVILFLLAAYAEFLMRQRRKAETALQETISTSQMEKSRSEGILEALGDAVSIQDPSFRILYQNRIHREMMGAHAGDYCYRAYQQREQVCDDCLLVEAFRDGGTHTREKVGQSRSGLLTVEITVSALKDQQGKIIAGIEAVRDISERKRVEQEIIRLNNDLRKQAEELKAANSDLETFSYSVSHDLRTPLTRISCSAEALKSGYSGNLDETGKFFLDNLWSAGEQMHEIIEAMLDLSRATRGDLAVHDLDLVALARSVFSGLSHTWPGRQVEFTAPEEIVVRGDERLLRIALENLMENSWKFTEHQNPARIAIGIEQGDDGPVYFVRDNGAGFDMQHPERLFMPFSRFHKDADFPGTGIGLATVRRVIQRHGGRIWAESSPGAGATFFFTLPGRHNGQDAPS